jgi:AcrR family transcriptional regulator
MADAAQARELIGLAIQEDRGRSQQRGRVKGMIDGNAPYDEGKRKEAGIEWTANLNFGDGKAILQSARTPYYQLFKGVQNYATFATNYDTDNPDRTIWEDSIAKRFTCLLDRWKQFDWHMQASQYQLLLEGWSPLIFDKDGDWRFKSIPANAILVPKEACSTVDDRLPWVAVRVPYRVHELYDFIRNPDAAKDKGWNVELVKQVIMSASQSMYPQRNWNTVPWETWQQDFKNKDLAVSYTKADIVYCCYLFVREFAKGGEPGKVSKFIVTEQVLAGAQNTGESSSVADGFLYEDIGKYDDYGDAMTVFFLDSGDGTWHGQRGLAMECFKHVEVMNRLKCRAVDGAFIRGSLVIKPNQQSDLQKMQVAQVGPVTYIPPGTEVVTGQLTGAIDEALAVDRLLTNHLANNIGHFNQRSVGGREDGRGEARTAAEIQAQIAKEATLSDGQITLYYSTLDCLYEQVFKRALTSSDPEAIRFRELLKRDGVPQEALDDMEYVRANRLAGYGSLQMRQMSDEQMLKIFSMLPTDGQRNVIDDYISTWKGPDKVSRYNPRIDYPDVDEAWAAMENAVIKSGEVMPVISGQDPVKHLTIHLADVEEQMSPLDQAIQVGEQIPAQVLQEAMGYLRNMLPHVQEHLQLLRVDPYRKQVAQKFDADLKAAVAFNGKLYGELRKAERAERQQQLDQQTASSLDVKTEAQIRNEALKTEADINRKDIKTQADIALKARKAQSSESLQTWQADQKNRREAATTLNGIQLDRVKTLSKNANGGSKKK